MLRGILASLWPQPVMLFTGCTRNTKFLDEKINNQSFKNNRHCGIKDICELSMMDILDIYLHYSVILASDITVLLY